MLRSNALLSSLVLAATLSAADFTALDRYVAAPDPAFHFELLSTSRGPGFTAYVLNLVSQNWLTRAEVDRTEWQHWLTIIKPDRVASSTGLLLIDGGSNGGRPPVPDPTLVLLATQSNAVVADLGMVPNQPLRFTGDGRPRSEDSLIAYTWNQFLNTGDERWPARLPMTKSAVRAMDAVTAFCASESGGRIAVSRFVVAGASKRGWTTWTTAAVDPRVIAIAPLVIDALNLEASFIHHFRAYGFWSPAIQDYTDIDLVGWLGTPQFQALLEIEDPYQYRERFALPKYIVNSSGDQYFLPDSSQFYFGDLPGEKYLRYVPNTDHSMQNLEVAFGLLAWLESILGNTPRPRFYWRADPGAGSLLLRTIDPPSQVKLWQATNPGARDFRLMSIGPAWTSTPVQGENGIYAVTVPAPAQGWTAFFLEMTFPGGGSYPFTFTTEVVVTPDVYPFDDPVFGPASPPMAPAARRR